MKLLYKNQRNKLLLLHKYNIIINVAVWKQKHEIICRSYILLDSDMHPVISLFCFSGLIIILWIIKFKLFYISPYFYENGINWRTQRWIHSIFIIYYSHKFYFLKKNYNYNHNYKYYFYEQKLYINYVWKIGLFQKNY